MLRKWYKDLIGVEYDVDQQMIGTETTLNAGEISSVAEEEAVKQGTFSIGVLFRKLDEILQKIAAALFA